MQGVQQPESLSRHLFQGNKNSDENKARTDKRFSAILALFFVTLAVLVVAGTSTAALVYGDSSNSSSNCNSESPAGSRGAGSANNLIVSY